MIQEARTYALIAPQTVTTSGATTGFVRLPRPARAATLFANIGTASGTLKIVLQRGIRAALSTDTSGLPVSSTTNDAIEWFDYAAFTATGTAGKRIMPIVITETPATAQDSLVTTTGQIASGTRVYGSIGTLFRGAYQLSGTSPSFTFEVMGEFEF